MKAIIYHLPADEIVSLALSVEDGEAFMEEIRKHPQTVKHTLESFVEAFNSDEISDQSFLAYDTDDRASFGKHNPNFQEDYEKLNA